ncbi:MAG TPA: PEP/pyruvate-binding domain-containing protein [Streptosporangiaceae bacterium]
MRTDRPLVMALDDPGAVVAAAGGKGAALARLARAGLPVPPGFHVTTRAYADFAARAGLPAALRETLSGAGAADPAAREAAARRIGVLLAAAPVPAPTAAAVTAAYAALGADVPVAVRSSATSEDLPGMSAAGQHDTYLNVRGAAAVLDAVRRCWASLWTARAIGYRERHGAAGGEVSLAVVVQRLVPADAAGVLFTVSPVAGQGDQVAVNAGWGLGEAVVSGRATPDVILVSRAGGVTDYRVGGKEVMTVPAATGTRDQATPGDRRRAAVLSPAEASDLARTGLRIEELFGAPVDVEWARAGQEMFILQARPITGPAAPAAPAPGLPAIPDLPAVPPGEEWNDSLAGDYLWSSGNLGEALQDVMTPATWSFMQLFMTRAIAPPTLPAYPGYGRVGGRFYANVSMSASLTAALGVSVRRYVAIYGPVLGKLPPAGQIPTVPLPRWKVIRLAVPATAALLRRARKNSRRLPDFIAGSAGRCDGLRRDLQRIEDPGLLAAAWPERVEPLFLEACDMLAATGAAATPLLQVPGQLERLIGAADTAVLLSGADGTGGTDSTGGADSTDGTDGTDSTGGADGTGGGDPLASLTPATALARLARGEIDRAEFTRLSGHRGPHEAEVSAPRPAEDPGWIDRQLAELGDTARDAGDLLARQAAARQAIRDRLGTRLPPRQAAAVRRRAGRWARAARAREAVRSELARSFWVLRAWVLRAGELSGHGDDLFFLSYPEILGVLGGEPAPLAAVPGRRAAYELYRGLPVYPTLIRGRFDPVRWAADPGRRTDLYDEHGTSGPPGEAITGFGGAPGVAEGVARVIGQVEDAGLLRDGEILVTTVTNIGWTPVFPRAAAIVTDVGAPLSHAAIVARELGVPAVVGCGNATMRLRSGDLIRVDGGTGTVEVLHPG